MNLFLNGESDKQSVQTLLTCKQIGTIELLFQKVLDDTKTQLVTAEDVVLMHRLQGRARVIDDFLKALNDAPSVMERLK